jgi:hypothetical protein
VDRLSEFFQTIFWRNQFFSSASAELRNSLASNIVNSRPTPERDLHACTTGPEAIR